MTTKSATLPPPTTTTTPVPVVTNKITDSFKAAIAKKEDAPVVEQSKPEAQKQPEPTKVDPPKQPETPKQEAPKVEPKKETSKKEIEESWSDLRKKYEETESKYQELEKKYKETESKIPLDYEEVKKEREELIKQVERFNLEESPRFKEKYDRPLENLLNTAKKALTIVEADVNGFTEAIQMKESKARTEKLAEMMDGLDDFTKGKLTTAITDYDRIREQRVNELANPSDTFKRYQVESQRELEQSTLNTKKVMRDVIDEIPKKIEWFQPKNEDTPQAKDWNERIEKVKARAVELWEGKHDQRTLADATFHAALAPMLNEALEIAQARNAELANELAALKSATPSSNAGSTPSETGGTGEKPLSAHDAFMKAAFGKRG